MNINFPKFVVDAILVEEVVIPQSSKDVVPLGSDGFGC